MASLKKFYQEIPGAKLNGKKSSVKNFSRIWVYLPRLSSFLEVLKNTVPFATGSCRKFTVDVWLNGKRPKCLYGNDFPDNVFFLVVMS